MSKKRRISGVLIVVGLLAVVVVGFMVVQSKMGQSDAVAADTTGAAEDESAENGDKKDAKVPVELAAVQPRSLHSYFQATGSIEAKRNVELIAKAQGQVTRLRVEEGDFVKAGTVLLEIEHEEEQILLEKAEVNLATAERERERAEELLGKGLTADREFEQAQNAHELAIHERDLARVMLENKIVRAPFAGQITKRFVELGQTVSPGLPLVAVADVSPLEVRLFLPEQIVHDLEVGQAVEIRPDISPDTVLGGTVYRIAPVVDAATSTVKITIRLADKLGAARVGSFVRVRITTDVHKDVASVPKRALVPEAGATYVFVAEADSVRKIEVTTGYSDDDHIEILEGLSMGEQVVSVGQGALREGTKIRDLEAERAEEAEQDDGGDSDASAAEEQDAELADSGN